MLEPRNKSPVFVIAYLFFSHLCLYILHAFIVNILICLIYLYFIDIYMLGLFMYSHLYLTKRAIVVSQLLI